MGEIELLELAERVEKLVRPSEGSDALIRCALFGPGEAYVKQSPINGAWCIYHGVDRSGAPKLWEGKAPRGKFTGSIDAALSLVPEGMLWGLANVSVREPRPIYGRASATVGHENDATPPVEAATPALALCAAALRARASITRTTGDGDGNGL